MPLLYYTVYVNPGTFFALVGTPLFLFLACFLGQEREGLHARPCMCVCVCVCVC